MKKQAIALLGLMTTLYALPALAQDWKGTGRVQGIVTDEAGEPLEGAEVKIWLGEDESRGPDAVLTNKKGRWAQLGIKYGTWNVRVLYDGKVPSDGQVPVSSVKRDVVRVKLRDIPQEALVDEEALRAKEMLEKGNALLAEGQFAAARAEYEGAMDNLDAELHPMVLQAIARSYGQEGDNAAAIDTLKKVVELEPENTDALKLISNLLVAEGREAEAQEFIARLPEGETIDAEALLNVGIDLYNNNDLDAALVQFNRVVGDYPDEPLGYYYRGLVHLGQENNELARADLTKCLELDPEGPNAAEAQEFLSYLGDG